MAKVTIVIDTEEQTIAGDIDGKAVADIQSASAYLYQNYYGKGYSLSWNIQASSDTGDDDYKSYTSFCSAAEMEKKKAESARASIHKYFEQKRGK